MLKLIILALVYRAEASVGKSTYAMSHPFAYKAWMEKFLPTAENVVQKNSTATCNEWVKLCIDDGTTPFVCSGPQGNVQLHTVGAYKRDSGTLTMETLEAQFTAALGGMKQYDPFMELHAAFYTSDLDHYVSAFKAASIPTFASTFVQGSTTYHSLAVQVDGSLQAGVGSLLMLLLVGHSSLLGSASLYSQPVPLASAAALGRAKQAEIRPLRSMKSTRFGTTTGQTSSPPPLTMLHVSWPSSNVTRDATYFEGVLGGVKTSLESSGGITAYTGQLFAGDKVELRWAQSSTKTQGPSSVADWEAYTASLHSQCIPIPNPDNQGFDRLADQHIGGHATREANEAVANLGAGAGTLDGYITRQKAAKLP